MSLEGVITETDARTVPLQGLGPNPTINGATIFIIFAKFFYLFILSLILGIAFGLGGAWMLKKCDASSTPQVKHGKPSRHGTCCSTHKNGLLHLALLVSTIGCQCPSLQQHVAEQKLMAQHSESLCADTVLALLSGRHVLHARMCNTRDAMQSC